MEPLPARSTLHLEASLGPLAMDDLDDLLRRAQAGQLQLEQAATAAATAAVQGGASGSAASGAHQQLYSSPHRPVLPDPSRLFDDSDDEEGSPSMLWPSQRKKYLLARQQQQQQQPQARLQPGSLDRAQQQRQQPQPAAVALDPPPPLPLGKFRSAAQPAALPQLPSSPVAGGVPAAQQPPFAKFKAFTGQPPQTQTQMPQQRGASSSSGVEEGGAVAAGALASELSAAPLRPTVRIDLRQSIAQVRDAPRPARGARRGAEEEEEEDDEGWAAAQRRQVKAGQAQQVGGSDGSRPGRHSRWVAVAGT